MHILQFAPRIPYPAHDGGAVYVYYTIKYLSLLGNKVDLVSFNSNRHEQDPDHIRNFVTLYDTPGDFLPYNIPSVGKAVITHQPISIQHRMRLAKMAPAIDLVEQTPDIILLEGIHTAHFLTQIKKKFPQVPIVLRQSNVEYLVLKRNARISKNPLIKAFYYQQYLAMKKYELEAMKKVDAITAITPFDQQIFLNHLPNITSFVSPAGAEMPKNLGLQRHKNRILSISNWLWKPNYDGLVWFLERIWPKILQQRPDVEIDIIGIGLSQNFIDKYKNRNTHFLGLVNDLTPFRQKGTLFIAPLFSGSGMKLKVVEGMANGLPIITTKIGAEGIDIKSGIHYLEANSELDFISGIIELLDNEPLRKSIEMNAIEIVKEKYTWESISSNLQTFLESLI